MSIRRLLNADAALSVLLHALKALVALFVNWLVLHHFRVDDFVVWSVTSSILVVATASDLGIGQYTVTQLINSDRRDWPTHVSEGLGALLPLALAAGVFVFFAIKGPTPLYNVAMATLLAARIATIPFAAVLNAVNQYKVRKAIEFVAYLLAAAAIGVVILAKADVHLALVALNATFLVGAAMTVVAAKRYIAIGAALDVPAPDRSAHVFRTAIPFMANNLSGLLTYGGFMWLSSLALPRDEVAKLAILHGFVLMNLYQVYDVFLKSRQSHLADPAQLAPYRLLNTIFMLTLPIVFVLTGRPALGLIGNQVSISLIELALYGVFMSLEMGNLFVQSIAQVTPAHVHRLNIYSAIRATMLAGFVIGAVLPLDGGSRLLTLLACLSLGSMSSFGYLLYWTAGRNGRESSIRATSPGGYPTEK